MRKTLGDGSGLAFLLEQSSSPSRARLQQAIAEKFPNARWHVYEPVDLDIGAPGGVAGLRQLRSSRYYKLDEAQVIVSLDCDFIGSEENAYEQHPPLCQRPGIWTAKTSSMSRLYAVESLFTLTGLNADHRLRVAAEHDCSGAGAVGAERS